MKFNTLKIGTRIGLAFAIVVGVIAAASALTQLSLSRLASNSTAMARAAEMQAQVNTARMLAQENAIQSMLILVASSAEQRARISKTIQEGATKVDQALKDLAAMGSIDEEKASLLAEVRARQVTYQKGVDRIVGMVSAGKQAEATFAADEEMIPMMEPFLSALASLEEVAATRLSAVEIENKALVARTGTTGWVASLATAVLAAIAGWMLAVSLTRPIRRALKLAERVADGDLSAKTHVSGQDEVSQLLRALNRMVDNLRTRVDDVREAADQVASASGQIVTGNTDLSQRTESQASNLQQTSASMAQVRQTFESSTRDAKSARAMAVDASSVAQRGSQVVGQVVSTMEGISASSRKIGEIITVIDSIAFQTNILALNAAVEAARAGEQGRGFAVVASEVRSLAQRSANAAKEIKTLIGASVGEVEAGKKWVGQAGDTIGELVQRVQEVAALIDSISRAAEQQSLGFGQIDQAMTELDGSTQQNAALVEEASAAAQSLLQQAQRLRESVSTFHLGQVVEPLLSAGTAQAH